MTSRFWQWWNGSGRATASPRKARPALERLESREVPAALVGLTTANQLTSIPSDFPEDASGFPNPAVSPPPSPTPINGLAAGERVVGIDFRPRTGQLYALAVDGNGTGTNGRLLTISGFGLNGVPVSVTANPVGTFTVPAAAADAGYGFDFNPTVDVIRVVNTADANFRLNPDTGAILGTDPALNPPGQAIDAAAYDRNFDGRLGSAGTTLYVINAATGMLQTQGGVNQVPSPNTGQLINVGPLGVPIDPTRAVGFDVQANPNAAQGPAFAVFDGDPGAGLSVGLYVINLQTGAATRVGPVGDGSIELSGLAVVPESSVGLGVSTALGTDSIAHLLVVGPGVPTARPGFPDPVTPFPGYKGALSTAVADVNRDAVLDLVVAAATAGNNGHVKVFSGVDGSLLFSFFSFENFAGGVTLAAGDVGGGPGGAADGFKDVVVAANGANGHVKVFSGRDGSLIGSFLAFTGFLGSVSVATSDLDLDRTLFREEIVIGAAFNGHVKAFNFDGTSFGGTSFFAFEGFLGPVSLAGGDVTGDGRGDVVVGTGAATGHVKVFGGGPGNPLTLSFILGAPGAGPGIDVGTADANRDGRLDVAVTTLKAATDFPAVGFFDGLTGDDVFASIVGSGPINSAAMARGDVSGGRV